MLILPHVLEVGVKYKPIHNFLPQKGIHSAFILPNPDGRDAKFFNALQKWAALPVEGTSPIMVNTPQNSDISVPLPAEQESLTEKLVNDALRPGYLKLIERYGKKELQNQFSPDGGPIRLPSVAVTEIPTQLELPNLLPSTSIPLLTDNLPTARIIDIDKDLSFLPGFEDIPQNPFGSISPNFSPEGFLNLSSPF